jgi:hypothetical protein
MNRILLLIGMLAVLPGIAGADPQPATQPATAPVQDRAAIEQEIKLDTDAIKSISDELAGHEKDAADAEALAKNPPANISDADRQAYIDKQKNDAQTAQDAAADARQHLKEAQDSLEQAKVRLKALNAKP